MKTYHIKTKYCDEKGCAIQKHKYPNGRDALRIMTADGEPLMVATTNLVDMPCEEGYAFIKDYSENEGIFACLVGHLVICPEPAEKWVKDGFGTVFPYVEILI